MIITKQKFKFQSYLYYVLLENIFFRLCYINIERYKIPRGDKTYLWNMKCHILMKGQRFIYQLLGYKQIDTTLQYIMVKQSNVKEVYRLG